MPILLRSRVVKILVLCSLIFASGVLLMSRESLAAPATKASASPKAPLWSPPEKISGSLLKLPKGKTLKTADSPDRKSQLIIRDEGEHGDFFYNNYYYYNKSKASYVLIGTFADLGRYPKITWTKESLSFEATSPVGPETVEVRLQEFNFVKKQLRSRLLKTEHMVHPG
jgi:hypothetical protein